MEPIQIILVFDYCTRPIVRDTPCIQNHCPNIDILYVTARWPARKKRLSPSSQCLPRRLYIYYICVYIDGKMDDHGGDGRVCHLSAYCVRLLFIKCASVCCSAEERREGKVYNLYIFIILYTDRLENPYLNTHTIDEMLGLL